MSSYSPTAQNDNAPTQTCSATRVSIIPKRAVKHRRAKSFVEAIEASDLNGWWVHLCKRLTPSKNTSPYLQWFSPAGKLLRSKPEVLQYLCHLVDTSGDEDEAYRRFKNKDHAVSTGTLNHLRGMKHYRGKFKNFDYACPKKNRNPGDVPKKKGRTTGKPKISASGQGIIIRDSPQDSPILDNFNCDIVLPPCSGSDERKRTLYLDRMVKNQIRYVTENPKSIINFPFKRFVPPQTFSGKVTKYMHHIQKWQVTLEYGEEKNYNAHEILDGLDLV